MKRSPKKANGPATSKKLGAGPIVLIGAGILILLAVVVLQLSSLPTTTATQTSPFEIPYPNVVRISLSDAKAAFDSQNAIFLDVRDAGTYGSSHIKGAINIPLTEIEARASELPKDRWIITYCT
jgi:hypothetical protein